MVTPFLPYIPMISCNGKSPGPESQTVLEGKTGSLGHLVA